MYITAGRNVEKCALNSAKSDCSCLLSSDTPITRPGPFPLDTCKTEVHIFKATEPLHKSGLSNMHLFVWTTGANDFTLCVKCQASSSLLFFLFTLIASVHWCQRLGTDQLLTRAAMSIEY